MSFDITHDTVGVDKDIITPTIWNEIHALSGKLPSANVASPFKTVFRSAAECYSTEVLSPSDWYTVRETHNTGTTTFTFSFFIPSDWTSGVKFYPVLMWLEGSGNAVFRMDYNIARHGYDFDECTGFCQKTFACPTPDGYNIGIEGFNDTICAGKAPAAVGVELKRLGSDASDTFNGALLLAGFVMESQE